jgi:hypothetical protein
MGAVDAGLDGGGAEPALRGCRFWLGTHQPGWLGRLGVPLFVSARRLRGRKSLPRAAGPWALDSGGYSELTLNGGYPVTAARYAAEVVRWADEAGGMAWAAVQDWMCEPHVLARTGLTVVEHQRRTVASYLELRALGPGVPWVPVLQGWAHADYLRHVEDYAAAGVHLAALPLVGLGSVCRRQDTGMAAGGGLRLHLFGYKVAGLLRCGRYAASADSLAWSFAARRSPPLPGCTHANCANCPRYALRWRERVLRNVGRSLARPVQGELFEGSGY